MKINDDDNDNDRGGGDDGRAMRKFQVAPEQNTQAGRATSNFPLIGVNVTSLLSLVRLFVQWSCRRRCCCSSCQPLLWPSSALWPSCNCAARVMIHDQDKLQLRATALKYEPKWLLKAAKIERKRGMVTTRDARPLSQFPVCCRPLSVCLSVVCVRLKQAAIVSVAAVSFALLVERRDDGHHS